MLYWGSRQRKSTREYDASRGVICSANDADGKPDNHKPDQTSDSSQGSIQLQPSGSDPSSYDLSLSDNSDNYSYTGVRASGDGQYVLIFDAPNKHFVLHRIDSTFNMNMVKAPWEDDSSTLRSQYPQLDTPAPTKSEAQPLQRRISKSAKNAPVAKAEPKRRKAAEKPKKKPPPREPSPEEDEESDDGLTIEDPDAPTTSQPYKSQSTPLIQRHISEDISDEDAEGEEYEDERNQDVDHLKLPSPANNAGGMSDEDLELDLEAELEEALKEGTGSGAGESDESEEE
ncbi:hypothetical protein D0Z07_1830 [Hyphodiscus hymeniophilus]|uniref:Transcription elongation factor Eaf N-terminal domain-containing protein n=1 Tax=Hyphodiscus hymeniophilus TaxID=353542 RepID=A0A9P6VPL7_9HELO|nr:hypothetical protein D0Z07_1830 [Hyphodiscus hymeniophilus]